MDHFGPQNTYGTPLGSRVTFQIESLRLIRVNGYQNQYLRPFVTRMNGTVQDKLVTMVDQFNGKVPTNYIASTCNEFIIPADRPETNQGRPIDVTIPNGWNEDRYVFIMIITTSANGIIGREMVTGYTDRRDAAIMGRDIKLAPDTVFYVNSITKMGTRQVNNVYIPVVQDSFSVFGGGIGAGAYNNSSPWKMTPQNLLRSTYASGIDGTTDIPENTIIGTDDRRVSQVPSLVSRNYNSPTQMLSKIVEGAFVATMFNNNTSGYSGESVANQIRGSMADPSTHHSAFLSALTNVQSRRTSTFDWKWLLQLDPTIDYRAEVSDEHYQTTQYSAPWLSPTIETTMAIVVSSMVTNLMTKSSLSYIEFSSTNTMGTALTGYQPETVVSDMRGFVSNLNFSGLQFSTEKVISDELGPILSQNNELPYFIHVKCDLNTDIVIEIQIGNGIKELYVFPSFSDSSISPMLTVNSERYRNNSRDIGELIHSVEDVVEGKMGSSAQANPMGHPFTNVNTQMNYGQPQPEFRDYTSNTRNKY